MFRISGNWSSLVVSVFTPKDATQRNRLVEWRLLVWMRLRRDAAEQFCWVTSRRLVWIRLKSTNSDKYTRVSTEPGFAATKMHGPVELHGSISSAFQCFNVSDESGRLYRSVDYVLCIRCLVWPPQAAEWTTRQRNWPDTATINCVANHGCDVVQVAHPLYGDNKLMSRLQFRLSFSRAETVLLNTWSPTRQLVYHMLRVFLLAIQSYHGISIIKRYHIKTLMMWICELYPHSWNACFLVSICTQLLHELAAWLISGEFPMYFIKHVVRDTATCLSHVASVCINHSVPPQTVYH